MGAASMTRAQKVSAVAIGRWLLDGVGDPDPKRDSLMKGAGLGVYVVHVRRAVTAAEEAVLPAWFMESKPTDRAGGEPLCL